MSVSVKIGVYHERESRKLTAHTSYAADYINHVSVPGDYPLYLTFEGGFNIPMPYWIGTTLKSKITDGKYFSGFGGVNYSSTDVEPTESEYRIRTYSYTLRQLVSEGQVTVYDEWTWLLLEQAALYDYIRAEGITWEILTESRKAQELALT